MDPQSARSPRERLSVTQMVSWALFVLVLVAGLSLLFQNADRIVPMLDVVTDR